MSSKGAPDVGQLFANAAAAGDLSQASVGTLKDLGARIQQGLTPNLDDIKSTGQLVLVTMQVDDSGSIRFASLAQTVRDGHNQVLDALGASKQTDDILVHTCYLNGKVLFPYGPLSSAVRLDDTNYDPNLGTPLYDEACVILGRVLAETQQHLDNGIEVRSVTLIITDGRDESSHKKSARDVHNLVTDLLKQERHIVAAMGICPKGSNPTEQAENETLFRGVFAEMGIRDEWVLTPTSDPSSIRKAFQVFSQSAVRASQGGASFSATAVAGFGE